jgi:hypothetical protein
MKNAINWFEIPVTDFYRAKTFYEQILNIKMHEANMHGEQMAFFEADEKAVSGALVKGEGCEPCDKGSKIYLNANPNMDLVIERIVKYGGKIIDNKFQISPEIGHIALFLDTEGNKIFIHSSPQK